MIQVKDAEVYSNLLAVKYHPILIELELWILQRYSGIVITSGYRSGDTGVHGTDPCRGKDYRTRGLMLNTGKSMIPTDAESLCAIVNIAWEYDSRRPEKECAAVHGKGEDNEHIHLKCCHRSKLR